MGTISILPKGPDENGQKLLNNIHAILLFFYGLL
jgi:hypothetical protein